jgi:DinB superfamily
MRTRITWTDRRFDFNFPSGIYPEIIERLRGVPARLEEHTKNLTHEVLTSRYENRWSIQENAGHLLDLETLVQQRIDEYIAGASVLHAADMTNRKTFEANHNEVPIARILAAFRSERTTIVDRLESLDVEVFSRAAIHPRLNTSMRLVDMLFFQAEHDDYHLTRIAELVRGNVRSP